MKKLFPILLAFLAACSGDDGDDGGLSGGNGDLRITASGESLALGGYAFPPANADAPAFVDGWEVRFEKLLVVVDHVWFSQNPDTSPADQSQLGEEIAHVEGPWAIDLHRGGPIQGKGGSDEQAVQIAELSGRDFDPTLRYGFSFGTTAAADDATLVGIASDDADYASMVLNGWSTLYVGTATFKGTDCRTSDNTFDFTQLPTTVKFRFGFASPTEYLNCQNPDNDPAAPLGEEEHQRGVQVRDNTQTTAQVTIHTDHPFWGSFLHDAQLRFDALAALAKPGIDGEYQVTLADAAGIDYHAFEYNGAALPWRSCVAGQDWPAGDAQMSYDDLGATQADFAAYLTYNQRTQGHLNADGECFVEGAEHDHDHDHDH